MRNQEILKPKKEKDKAELEAVEDIRGTPLVVGTMEEMIDDNHCIVSTSNGPEYYVNITSFVDKDQLEPGCTVLMHNKTHTVVGLLADNNDPMVSMMKVEKAPLESYSDIGGLESQIQEIKEAVELPLTHPELYEDIGIKPPKGVILYGQPGTGKTLLAKAVANQTSATFLRIVGSELIQKYLGDGPKLVREVFKVADENAPSIVFIDEIDSFLRERSSNDHQAHADMKCEFMTLWDGIGTDDNSAVIVLGASNRPWDIDDAIQRRLSRSFKVDLPSRLQRKKIISVVCFVVLVRSRFLS